MHHKKTKKFSCKGFTLIELLVVIAIIAVLSSIIIPSLNSARKKAYENSAQDEIMSLQTALQMYLNDTNGVYPPDVARDLPAEIKTYLGNEGHEWPKAPWPGSVYDWDNWTIDGQRVVQISIRFCPGGGPLSACQFPDEPWATGFGVNSAYYYCIEGACRPHVGEPINYPGYCANCTVQPYTP
jgi:prepilin-type N-terminal cleavage/methylation domain-containing protein